MIFNIILRVLVVCGILVCVISNLAKHLCPHLQSARKISVIWDSEIKPMNVYPIDSGSQTLKLSAKRESLIWVIFILTLKMKKSIS